MTYSYTQRSDKKIKIIQTQAMWKINQLLQDSGGLLITPAAMW